MSWKVVSKKSLFLESQPSKTACLKNSIRSRCSAGTWSATLGASSHSSCRACPVGTYSNLPGLVGIMSYWFCCKTFMWYYVIWLWMIVYDYMVGILHMWHFDHRSQPAGATSWKTCLACPKGTYQPIEAATRTTSLEGCCLLCLHCCALCFDFNF